MINHINPISEDIVAELRDSITGEVKVDEVTRKLFSTDASIQKLEPLGVVFPRTQDEIEPIVKIAGRYHIPLIPRGSGSSLAGQAIGNGLIIDCSRYLNHLVKINPEEQTAVIEPGLILDNLNREAKKYGLQFGPDPASSERATLGGCIGNNATGAHSITYGMTADHIVSADVVLADGIRFEFKQTSLAETNSFALKSHDFSNKDISAQIYNAAVNCRKEYAQDIRRAWPKTWRRVSGYNLNYLLPWSPSRPVLWESDSLPYPPVEEGSINLAQLFAGSEGTLGILRAATIRLVPIKANTILSILRFDQIDEACDLMPEILELAPSAVELIPRSLLHLASSVPAYARQFSFISGDPAAILVVEFSGSSSAQLSEQAAKMNRINHLYYQPITITDANLQKQVWAVRKMGLGILMSRLGDFKPVTFIEDMAVPAEKLGEFVRGMDVILKEHGTQVDYYGHASAGCLHIRPLLNLKSSDGRLKLRSIAEASVDLVLNLGGSISAEHGDGITRGEWIERAYGARIMQAFRSLKNAADPQGILNPGKIVDTPRMDAHLRYDESYHPHGWTPVMSFSSSIPSEGKLVEAIEQCNGAGVCRKSGGVMCPSFQASQDELYSTRGRANLLRTLVAGEFSSDDLGLEAVKETLDKCLACKGCKSECPSAVDMAKLKYEFYEHYYSLPKHSHPLRDYLFAYISLVAKFGQPFTSIVNPFLSNQKFSRLRQIMFGISAKRNLPVLAKKSLHFLAREINHNPPTIPDCLLLSDGFNEYFFPQTGIDVINVINSTGRRVRLLDHIGAGRTLISKGFLKQAKKHAQSLLAEIARIDPSGKLPVIGIEPSEIYTLKDEYLDLFPNDPSVTQLAERAFMIDEYLIRPGDDGESPISRIVPKAESNNRTVVLIHGHCYQKAQPPAKDGYPGGVEATTELLESVGYNVTKIDDGCCGMAGAFGYEQEHYQMSMQVGELALFPAIQGSEAQFIAAAGISCKSQIEDGTGRNAVHPITLVARLLKDSA